MPLDLMRLRSRRFPSLPYPPQPFCERGLPEHHEFLVGIELAVALPIYACVAVANNGFCVAPHVLGQLQPRQIQPRSVPVPNVYLFCTLSTKDRLYSSGLTASRFSLARIPKPTAAGRLSPPKYRPEWLPPEIAPVLAAGAKDGEMPPDAQERKGRPFPPQETAF